MNQVKATMLTVLMTLCGFAALYSTGYSKDKSLKNAPVFSKVVYQGDDQVYKDYPLESDEFYKERE